MWTYIGVGINRLLILVTVLKHYVWCIWLHWRACRVTMTCTAWHCVKDKVSDGYTLCVSATGTWWHLLTLCEGQGVWRLYIVCTSNRNLMAPTDTVWRTRCLTDIHRVYQQQELDGTYSSTNTIPVIKLRRMRWGRGISGAYGREEKCLQYFGEER